MILPLGSFFNVACIIVGGVCGLALGGRLPERVRHIVFSGLGLCVLIIGIQMGMQSKNLLVLVFSVLLGSITGELLNLEKRLTKAADKLKTLIKSSNSKFTEGFVSTSVLFCIGSMAILGSFEEGLRGEHTILFTKSILDGFAAMAFAATYGAGVLFSALPVFLYQGTLTELATYLQPIMTEGMMTELTATGGALIIGIGISLLELRTISLTNMLPALFFAPILTYFLG
ncbi:DUF554 domain-containing protein [Halodesulfovibrio marinisediminis]|uniref:DUF554 domain-containing protein n=1 Tax=Halodesulfovibrio marinisediminis DSM 17456 TaxID=1121457 RepID=A0A1N6DTV4_9BACT|nr:DUF554 domain-containing protein [Halodesulfovibrio marinisediminis]SIN74124.1 hypothetical protein SAMN02745161_0473 [Halodesulfovibrio marinisediminis DSM 17456]